MTTAEGTVTDARTAFDAAAVPIDKVSVLAFTDTDADTNQIGGTLSWTAPADVSNVTNYVVYASVDGVAKGTQIGADVTVGTNELVIPADTTFAAYIIVVTKNTVGEAIAANYVNIAVTDNISN